MTVCGGCCYRAVLSTSSFIRSFPLLSVSIDYLSLSFRLPPRLQNLLGRGKHQADLALTRPPHLALEPLLDIRAAVAGGVSIHQLQRVRAQIGGGLGVEL